MSPSRSTLIVAFVFTLFLAALPLAAQQDPSATLNALEQTSRNSIADISHLRVEKWKADGATKKSAQTDSDSIQRNMASALPELIAKVRTTPGDLNANFKLYRNLNVLYDVFSRFTETAGAFGSREDFDTLAKDLDGIDSARRALADRLDTLSASAQSELTQYRAQARTAQASPAEPPKKIVIDDSEPAKPTAKKKKPAAKPADPNANPSSANSGTPAPGTSPK
jgi:hypothetical protein